jgi:putative ABC transport system permease protein
MWGLKMKTGLENGDTITYTAEGGDKTPFRLIGALPMRLSVFQGSILVDEANFTRLYPSESGYRAFLVHTEPGKELEVAAKLNRTFERYGMDAVPAIQRLREFYTVESTYLAMFLALGGFGLALGALGAAMVVLRNLYERRGETAMLFALGYARRTLFRIYLLEHGILFLGGLVLGAVASATAIVPVYLFTHAQTSFTLLSGMLALVLIANAVCLVAAVVAGIEKNPIASLRQE